MGERVQYSYKWKDDTISDEDDSSLSVRSNRKADFSVQCSYSYKKNTKKNSTPCFEPNRQQKWQIPVRVLLNHNYLIEIGRFFF